MDIVFNSDNLSAKDKKIYELMNERERQQFEKTWILIETQKYKLVQQKNRSKERATREKKIIVEKERKKRNHRLIERGAILEANIKDAEELTNEQIKEVVELCINTNYGRRIVEEVKVGIIKDNENSVVV